MKILRRTANSHPVALPLGYNLQDASPQAISERTSYCQTRLEFLPYTQVIPLSCTASGCGPPRGFTHASPCSYVARLASGLVHATLIFALLRLAFTVASPPQGLNQATYSTLVGSFFNRNAVTDLRPLQLLVSVWFQILFHRPLGLLLSFPSRY